MAIALDLDTVHPLYAATQATRIKARDLFEGSQQVKSQKTQYLYTTDNESSVNYDARLNRAVYDNWVEVVVSTRQALSWRKVPTREIPFDEENVDGFGTNADEFFKQVTTDAAVDGIAFVLIDRTPIPEVVIQEQEGRPLTERQEEELQLRTTFSIIAARNVFDWKIGDDQSLEFVTLRRIRTEKPGPGLPLILAEQRVIWTKHDFTVYQEENAENKIIEPVDTPKSSNAARVRTWKIIEGPTPHNVGFVPIVPFYGFKVATMWGVPVTKDILDHALLIYNKGSDRDWAEWLTTSPTMYTIGNSKPEVVVVGSSNGIHLQDGEIGYLETSGNGISELRASERDLIRRIHEIALRQAKRDTAQVQAADSLKQEQSVFFSSLSSAAVVSEQAEKRCWEYQANWEGNEGGIEVEYSKDFSAELIESAMMKTLSDMQSRGQLSLETLLDHMKEMEVLPINLDTQEEINRIMADTERFMAMQPKEEIPPKINDDEEPEQGDQDDDTNASAS